MNYQTLENEKRNAEKKDEKIEEILGNQNEAIIYDYLTVEVKEATKQLVVDTYENLGWQKVSNGFGTINFKRSRNQKNKNELKKIERQIDSSIKKIEKYEDAKKTKGLVLSIGLGVIGTLVMGTGMALIMEFDQMLLGILLGVLGIVMDLPCYHLYKKIEYKSTNKVLPLIEEEYDRIENLCNEAIRLMK